MEVVHLEPELDAKVAALRDRASYPGCAFPIDAVETHMSWVFLTASHAYKLKKAQRPDRVDFGSPSARRFYCLEELRLNRRLAPDVYLDVVPLALEEDGHMRVGGSGRPVDWLVKMRRLPARSMLDSLIATRAATTEDMRRIAGRLAGFYAGQSPTALEPAGYRALLERHIDESERELVLPEWNLPAAAIRVLCAAQREFLAREAAMFDKRVGAGRVVEGHGDLRPEHVCVGDHISIIDAVEFSAELRTLDAADDIAFLMLECERAGSPLLGHALRHGYEEISGDAPPRVLYHFHESCRAASRARLAIRHLAEPRYRSSPVWEERTKANLGLAQRHIAACGERLAAAAPA